MALFVVIGAVVGIVGAAAYVWFSGGSGEPSTAVTAPPIATTQSPPTTEAPSTTADAPSTTGAPETTVVEAGGAITYQISQEESTASYQIGEILRGQDNLVIGTTDQVAAELLVDLSDPSSAQLGTVVINARTFATDSSFRDRAVRSFVLQSATDEFEFMMFEPTSIDGLPETVEEPPIAFTVTGDLTIRTITQSVTFDVELSEVSEERITGRAQARVNWSDFELTIPNVQQVTGIDEEVDLILEFVALPVG